MDLFDGLVPERNIVAPKPPILSDYRKYNKAMVTQVLNIVDACNHKIYLGEPPRINCEHCWMSYFNNDGPQMNIWIEMLNNHNEKTLKNQFGDKWVRWLKRFIAAIKVMKEQNEK